LGVRRQPEASPTPPRKSRYQVRGHPDFHRYLKRLKASNRSENKDLARLIDDAIIVLEERATAGESVPRDLWPKAYAELKLPNLFRFRLDRLHRMLYSIMQITTAPPFIWIIEVMDHTRYDRLFGYD